MESSCPQIPFEIGRSGGTSRISRVGIFSRDKRTQDNSEHQGGSNPDTQGDGWLFFFKFFLFANKVIFTILLRRLYYKMVAMTTVHHKTDNKL